MSDLLDFHADFWERKLDFEPQNVDNIYGQDKKGVTYAIDDYRGFDPVSVWMQSSPENETNLPTARAPKGRSQGNSPAKNYKHFSFANTKSYD